MPGIADLLQRDLGIPLNVQFSSGESATTFLPQSAAM